MKNFLIIFFILFFHSAYGQQTIDKLNVNQLKLPKESVNKATIVDGAGQVKSSTVTSTELGYLSGLTDTLTNLLSGKANDSDVVKLTTDQSISGTKTFTGKLVASSTINGSVPCPVMTEAQRNLISPAVGDCVYNSTSLELNVYDGTQWKEAGGGGGISLWTTATPYIVDDVVIESDKIYRCIVAHTSGTFAADLLAGKWTEVSSGLQAPVSLADGGTNKALTASLGGVVWVDADSFEILAPGVSGQVLQSNGAAAPTWVNKSISAKAENASSVTLEEIQVYNNQLTQTDTNKHKIESGNKNILVNPSFEHATFSTGWTNSAGTFTEETAGQIDGLKAAKLVLSSQTMSLTQSSTLYAAQFANGVQGLASVRVKSDVALKVCSVQAGTVSSTNCVDTQANNKWGLYKIPFIMGATSNGISIASTGAVSGTVYIDDAFVGAVDLKADIDQSRIAGSAYFAGTASCTWSRTSTTLGAFGATAACPGPTIEYSSMGSWQTTDADLPRVTVNNLPAGTYKAKFITSSSASINNVQAGISINDGITTCEAFVPVTSSTIDGTSIVECTFVYTSSGNRVFELYGGSGSGTLTIANQRTVPRASTKFILEYFGSGSVYTSTNADTDWASCGHTTSSFTGFGTVSAIETQCKREGGDLLMRGKFTAGTNTAVEARVALPLWNGVQLVSAGSSVIPSVQTCGSHIYGASAAASGNTLCEPNVGYVTFGIQSSTSSGLTKLIGTSLTSSISYSIHSRIPISGWQNSNIIIGQFNGLESCTDTLECTDTFSAYVSNTGIVSGENIDWINGNASVSSNNYTLSFKSGIFTQGPNCTFVSVEGNQLVHTVGSGQSSASSITVWGRRSDNGGIYPTAFYIMCQKQGVDYIGKTAKAVASDQNLRTPGVTKGVVFSALVSSAGVVSNQYGDLISGNCTNAATSVCTLDTAKYSGTLNCSVTNASSTAVWCNHVLSGSSLSLYCWNGAGTSFTTSVAKTVMCHGVSP